MTDPKRPDGIRPEADEIQAYQRERRTRMVDRIGDVPAVSSEGGGSRVGGGWLMWLVIVVLLGGAYYLYKQLDIALAQQTLDQQRILRLEKQLNVTDESVSETSDQFQKQMEFLDTEIRKLWDNVWKRSKQQLADHETKIEAMEKTLASLNTQFASLNTKIAAAEKATAGYKSELDTLKAQLDKTRAMTEAHRGQIADLKAGGNMAEKVAKLEARIQSNEEWLESVNAFRKQVNRDLANLRDTVSRYHSGASPSP
ncbi:hypothetical protein [Litorivivens sp.]|uniref:hypothetical protein n=1 Tax=Litorivivens sp. TaxID=2020868 RepID=UPI003563D4C0